MTEAEVEAEAGTEGEVEAEAGANDSAADQSSSPTFDTDIESSSPSAETHLTPTTGKELTPAADTAE